LIDHIELSCEERKEETVDFADFARRFLRDGVENGMEMERQSVELAMGMCELDSGTHVE